MKSLSLLISAFFVMAMLTSSAWGQINSPTYTFPITGSGWGGPADFGAGSSLDGGNFHFFNVFDDYPEDLEWCMIGEPCQVPSMGIAYAWPWNEGPSCLDSTCTINVGGEGTNIRGSFITPAITSSGGVQVPITVEGEVSGGYNGSSGYWGLWDVTFKGKGTAGVYLVNYGFNPLDVVAFTYSFTGTATAHPLVTAIATPGQQPTGAAFSGQYLYESEQGSFGTINQLDPGTGQVLRSFLSPSPAGFDGRSTPSDLSAFNEHLFMTDVGTAGAGAVYEFDPMGTTIFNSFTVPFRAGAITADKARLFIGDMDSTQLLVTDHSGKAIRSLATTFNPNGMVFDPTNNLLWVVDRTQPMKIWQATTKGVPITSCNGPWNPGGPVYYPPIPAVDGLGGIALRGPSLYIAETGGYQWWINLEPGTLTAIDSRRLSCSPALPIPVRMAGVFPNIVNINSTGTVTTAVLSSAKFDATQIDPTTIFFGDTGTEAQPANWSLVDVNGDGRLDLLMNFNVPQMGIACDTTLVSITAKTLAGTGIRGTQKIRLGGCK